MIHDHRERHADFLPAVSKHLVLLFFRLPDAARNLESQYRRWIPEKNACRTLVRVTQEDGCYCLHPASEHTFDKSHCNGFSTPSIGRVRYDRT